MDCKSHRSDLFSLFEEKSWCYRAVKGAYFPHMSSLTWTNRERYKERERARRLKSRGEKRHWEGIMVI